MRKDATTLRDIDIDMGRKCRSYFEVI